MLSLLAQATDLAIVGGVGVAGASAVVLLAKVMPWGRNGRKVEDPIARERVQFLTKDSERHEKGMDEIRVAIVEIRKSSDATASYTAVIAEKVNGLETLLRIAVKQMEME